MGRVWCRHLLDHGGLAQLRDDLERFVFLLGGSDGEPLFGPDPASEAP